MENYHKTVMKHVLISYCLLHLLLNIAEAQSFDRGIYFNFESSLNHDDNVFRVYESLAQSDNFIRLRPDLDVIGGFGKHIVKGSYTGDYSRFARLKGANYEDHSLNLALDLDHSLRLSTKFEIGYQEDHEEPGTLARIQLDLDEYNKFDQHHASGTIVYGRKNSAGLISFNYRRQAKNYKSDTLSYLNYDGNLYTLTFDYRVAPNTKIYTQVNQNNLDYEPSQFTQLDNTYQRYAVGIKWNYSSKIVGDLNIGYQKHDYDDEGLYDSSGMAYNGEVTWALNTYTSMKLSSRRESVDSTLENSGSLLRNSYKVSLNHSLTELLNLNSSLEYSSDDLSFQAARNDKRYFFDFGVGYDIRSFITISAKYQYEERDSSLFSAEFKDNMIIFNIVVRLED